MVYEFIGVPGSGKTTVAKNLARHFPEKYIVHLGRTLHQKLKNVDSFKSFIHWAYLAFARYFSVILTPVIIAIYFRFFVGLVTTAMRTKMANQSNIKFIIYFTQLLNYQLFRLLSAKFVALVSRKAVIVDESFAYTVIRFRTFVHKDVPNNLHERLIDGARFFGLKVIRVTVDIDIAVTRYFDRDLVLTPEVLFKRWNLDRSTDNWEHDTWAKFDLWINELSNAIGVCATVDNMYEDAPQATKNLDILLTDQTK